MYSGFFSVEQTKYLPALKVRNAPTVTQSCSCQIPYVTLSCFAAACLLAAAKSWVPLLEYQRLAVEAGQWWRILSCHVVHWSFEQFFWDASSFLVLGILCETKLFVSALSRDKQAALVIGRIRFAFALLISCAVVASSVYFFSPQIETYRGLSGICISLFSLAAGSFIIKAWKDRDHLIFAAALFALALLTAKMLYEASTGLMLFVPNSSEFSLVPISHLSGAAAGILLLRIV